MTGLLRILVFILFGYILIKTVKYVISVFNSLKNQQSEEQVKGSGKSEAKINTKDVIDAQFEEIEDKDNTSSRS